VNDVPESEDLVLTNLKLELEVSCRYHDWRRAKIGFYVNCVRVVSLAGAVVTLVTLFADWSFAAKLLIGVNLIVALVTLFDLVFQTDNAARKHEVLYRRFKDLQASVARAAANWRDRIPEWRAEAQIIRMDEPPVFWAVYAECWNQAVGKFFEDRSQFRRVSWLQRALRNIMQFQPNDFPIQG
jgi:hypothetical protein